MIDLNIFFFAGLGLFFIWAIKSSIKQKQKQKPRPKPKPQTQIKNPFFSGYYKKKK